MMASPRSNGRAATAFALRPDLDPLELLRLRCWARATLYAACELSMHEAVDVLQDWADSTGIVAAIGQDEVQAIIADAFAAVREG